jgi:hypothetical protein
MKGVRCPTNPRHTVTTLIREDGFGYWICKPCHSQGELLIMPSLNKDGHHLRAAFPKPLEREATSGR